MFREIWKALRPSNRLLLASTGFGITAGLVAWFVTGSGAGGAAIAVVFGLMCYYARLDRMAKESIIDSETINRRR